MANENCLICGDIAGNASTSGIAQLYGTDVLRAATLWESDDLYLIPAPGTIIAGYLILTPKEHLTNFASLDSALLRTSSDLFSIIQGIGVDYGLPLYIAFEHGAAGPWQRGAACVEHAHLHLAPVRNHSHIRQILAERFSERRFSNLEELGSCDASSAYVLLKLKHGVYFYQTPEIPSQFVRRILAAQWGLDGLWNWVEYPFEDNFFNTLSIFRGRIPKTINT